MTLPAGTRSIECHEIDRVGDLQLIRGKANSRRGRFGGFLKKGSQQPDRAELNSDAKPIVVAPVFGNKLAIGIVKTEMASELIECRLAREAPIPALYGCVGSSAQSEVEGCCSDLCLEYRCIAPKRSR